MQLARPHSLDRLQVNVLSTGLLALLLLPQMQSDSRSTFNPHLVIVSSGAHLFTTFPCRTAPYVLEALNDRSLHDPMDRYNVTKRMSSRKSCLEGSPRSDRSVAHTQCWTSS